MILLKNTYLMARKLLTVYLFLFTLNENLCEIKMRTRHIMATALLALSVTGAFGDVVTNLSSSFTSATLEMGSITNLQRASVVNGYLSVGEKANSAASATVIMAAPAVFGQGGLFETNVILTLDWVQVQLFHTTMTAFNSNGDILFELAADTTGNLLWNGAPIAGAYVNMLSSSIELNLQADDTVDLYVNNILYGSSLSYNNTFTRNLANITFARAKQKNETARFDNLEVLAETIPEPAAMALFTLCGLGILTVRRFFNR